MKTKNREHYLNWQLLFKRVKVKVLDIEKRHKQTSFNKPHNKIEQFFKFFQLLFRLSSCDVYQLTNKKLGFVFKITRMAKTQHLEEKKL